MKVSVIIPVYNSEKFLKKCLESVADQTMDDYEVIIVNDGSTDSSQSIIDAFCLNYPDRFKSITVANGGQGRAKNIGIDASAGDYILNIDSDDTVSKDMLSVMYKAAADNNADIVVCDFYRVENGINYYEKGLRTSSLMSAVGQCWNKLIRRSLTENIRYPENLKYEDSEYSGKLLIKSRKTVFVFEPLYYYNVGHTSTMRSSDTAVNLDIIPVLEHIREFAEERDVPIDFDYLLINHILIDAVNRLSKLEKSPQRDDVLTQLRSFARDNLTRLAASKAFISENAGRKAVILLNYLGMYDAASELLQFKNKITGV